MLIPKELTIEIPWAEPLLRDFVALGDRVPHAVLLHGQAGVGKRRFAAALACALLCEAADAAPRGRGGCGACDACGWFLQANHPDFRRVTSEVIALEEGLDADDDGDADDDDDTPKSKKAPSREIKVEQIRALQRFVSVGTHRSGARVVVLYPLEALNLVAANALLKMLEEPPPRTVFVLVADRLGGVPATILSRCRKLAVPTPSTAVATAWLQAQGVDDPAPVLARAGGAPYAALALARDDDHEPTQRTLRDFLAAPDEGAALATAESLARAPAGANARIVHGMQLWVADCIAHRLAGRVRYHPSQSGAVAAIARSAPLDALFDVMQRLVATRRTVEHPLNARLMLEGLFLAYAAAVRP